MLADNWKLDAGIEKYFQYNQCYNFVFSLVILDGIFNLSAIFSENNTKCLKDYTNPTLDLCNSLHNFASQNYSFGNCVHNQVTDFCAAIWRHDAVFHL